MGRTSSASKRKYNEGAYSCVRAEIDKDLVAEWEKWITARNITKAGFIRQALKAALSGEWEPKNGDD